jgi:hypothetical protein
MKLSLIIAATLLLVPSFSLRAETVKFPEKDPAFSVTPPKGWTVTTDKEGNLHLLCPKDNATTLFIPQPDVKTDDDLAQFLMLLAHELEKNLELKDLRVGEINKSKTENGLKLFRLNASGTTSDGREMILPLAGFAPRTGVYFITSAPCPSDVYKARQKDNSDIINSITPIR